MSVYATIVSMNLGLLSEEALESSAIVANCRMNRERGIIGKNSYEAELYLNPLEFLRQRLETNISVAWLDLCCGTGKALIQAADQFQQEGASDRIAIQGVDLVDMFDPVPAEWDHLRLEASSMRDWDARIEYDLITCVHGLHYVGDKLGLIARALRWLKPTGLFVAHLDLKNVKLTTGKWFGSLLGRHCKRVGLHYQRRRRLLSSQGKRHIEFPWIFAGADDQAGPNFTGQPAVDSYYSPLP